MFIYKLSKRSKEGHSQSQARGDDVRPQHEAIVGEPRTNPADVGEAHAVLRVGGCHK